MSISVICSFQQFYELAWSSIKFQNYLSEQLTRTLQCLFLSKRNLCVKKKGKMSFLWALIFLICTSSNKKILSTIKISLTFFHSGRLMNQQIKVRNSVNMWPSKIKHYLESAVAVSYLQGLQSKDERNCHINYFFSLPLLRAWTWSERVWHVWQSRYLVLKGSK